MSSYIYLAGAIVTEVIGTTVLKLSDGFENVAFALSAVGLYILSFYFVSLALTELPVGLVYATWSAFGILLLAVIGIVFFDEAIDIAAIIGFALVLAGIFLLNVYSEAYQPA
ncbi:Quaternary ammonium compound-resistance protein qacE [Halorubrum californiense DSM 19288]|uniref:Quaternary ammonium compound-resistance protein qacE n=1 Tax=Halorubrum californiense DSM 19288 TaxID=1227465 RepID=M0EDN9_9EURY|nr:MULTISPECIES: multidrug efflux SMR transporter [Halorubrum]ELZ45865.1 Quaternary ammonium compound-resistance protein qacE [Halorubrum californiense DSM 19288]TKX69626.1 multidrug efflux SMR transporter [Halorubrum sp. GN11GM_10-3_MGM]